jgi:isopentenyl phosphate kinase
MTEPDGGADAPPLLLVLKVGGSLLSDKEAEDGIDPPAFEHYAALVADLATAYPGRLVLVTGGGARCHPVGRRINASAHDPYAAVALTEPAFAMRWEWTTRLRARGVRAVPIQSTALLEQDADGRWTASARIVGRLLAHGALPVLSSDCVLTADGSLRILSSDEVPAVALEIGVPAARIRVVALTDVPGIIAGPPGTDRVLPYVDAEDLDAVRPWLWDRARDATGAMTGKLEALAAHARRGVPCLITHGRRDAADLRHLMEPLAAWPASLPRTLIALGPRPGTREPHEEETP